MAEGEIVHLDLTDHVLTITMDRPEARNALSRQMIAELSAAFARSTTTSTAGSASSKARGRRSAPAPI